jgi:hypothetical protein
MGDCGAVLTVLRSMIALAGRRSAAAVVRSLGRSNPMNRTPKMSHSHCMADKYAIYVWLSQPRLALALVLLLQLALVLLLSRPRARI